MVQRFFIDVSGSPEARAHAYGVQAADRIRRGIGHYSEQLSAFNVDSARLDVLVARYLPIVEAFDEAYVVEMRAIARGAGVSFSEIMLINARTELLKIAENPEMEKRFEAEAPDGCTAIVAGPGATRDGKVIHAHNWDWKAECAETSVVLRVRRDDGPDYLTFTEAGALGRFGLNSAGLATAGNYLECERDYRDLGVPLSLIRRKILDQTHMAKAVEAVCTRKSASNNIVLSDRDGIILDFECAPDEMFHVPATNGLMIHANHWLSLAAQVKLRNTGARAFPCSYQRQVRAEGLLMPKLGSITVEDIREVLLDGYGSPWSICRPPRPSAFTNLSATVASLIMDPAEGTMEIAMLPALAPEFIRYNLHGVR